MTRGRSEIDQHWQYTAGEVRLEARLGRSFATDTSGQRPAPQQTGEAVQNRLTVEVRQAQEYGF
jgi:hypothetical protein